MKKRRARRSDNRLLYLFVGLLVLAGVAWAAGAFRYVTERLGEVASVFFFDSSTPESLRTAYAGAQSGGAKFKILIVPGHDNVASGASYGGLREADLTLALGKILVADLAKDPNLEVRMARTDAGYDSDIANYLTTHRADIIAYRAKQTALMNTYLASGTVASDVVVNHNFAPDDVAIKLYGINMWANSHGYQLLIHIHFNDTPRANRAKPGQYTGFAVYVPEHQFSNAKGSLLVGQDILTRLETTFHISTLPLESKPPTEDQQLIAIGSNNSLDASSVLIEYSYIYEPVIQDKTKRVPAFQTMAAETTQGIEDALGGSTYASVIK